jgi:hypothetical protein
LNFYRTDARDLLAVSSLLASIDNGCLQCVQKGVTIIIKKKELNYSIIISILHAGKGVSWEEDRECSL